MIIDDCHFLFQYVFFNFNTVYSIPKDKDKQYVNILANLKCPFIEKYFKMKKNQIL